MWIKTSFEMDLKFWWKKEVMKILLSRLCSTHHFPIINDVGSSWSISFISICIVQSTTSVNCASTLVQRLWKAIRLQIDNANLKVSFFWEQISGHEFKWFKTKKPGLWLADLAGVTIRSLFFWQETIWTHVLSPADSGFWKKLPLVCIQFIYFFSFSLLLFLCLKIRIF